MILRDDANMCIIYEYDVCTYKFGHHIDIIHLIGLFYNQNFTDIQEHHNSIRWCIHHWKVPTFYAYVHSPSLVHNGTHQKSESLQKHIHRHPVIFEVWCF